MPILVERLRRRDAAMRANGNHVIRKGNGLRWVSAVADDVVQWIWIPVSHCRQSRFAGLRIDMKLEESHASWVPNGRVVGSIEIVRIRETAATVLRWTVPRVDE